jgi:amino acid transporter
VDVESAPAEHVTADAAPVDDAAATHAADPAVVAVPIVPESGGYRMKTRLLGPPLSTDDLDHQRLGKPTALAVFASDNLSSSAYATEEILRTLIPVIGIAAFALVVPITVALLVLLGFLILSYRQTIKEYPSAGGAYIVTKDNFGKTPALVAGVSLLTDYILTVAVSVAAGTAALASAVPAVTRFEVPIAIGFVLIIAFGNLRGVKESGKVFAVPTYYFLLNMVFLLVIGTVRLATGHLPVDHADHAGVVAYGSAGGGLLMGASLFIVLRAFASGGAAVTGVEAISNGVPAFKEPAWKNARSTLVIMGSTLGVMFLGISIFAAHMHVTVYKSGTPTVISQVGKFVYGSGALGHIGYLSLQAGTLLILVLAANTSFADFPRLASFAASDHFMPRQLTKRGHRLVFSNGIISLAGASVVVLLATDAKVSRLIPLYALGVFTSFTLSQAGMARHHIRHKEAGWKTGLFVNGFGAFLTFVVDVIIAVVKFAEGAWVIILLVPILVLLLLRLNKQYVNEESELLEDAARAAEAPIMRRHVVLVFIDTIDLASARALQYARTLAPDEMRAVHFAVDMSRAKALRDEWLKLGFSRITLEIVGCPDRRIQRAGVEVVAEALADGKTEVSVLLPRIQRERIWHKLLHDRTADALASEISDLPHANVTFVPYHIGRRRARDIVELPVVDRPVTEREAPVSHLGNGVVVTEIAQARHRQQVTLTGTVHAIRIQPRGGIATMECRLRDSTGEISVVFLGRRHIGGIEPDCTLTVTGAVGLRRGNREIVNPYYTLAAPAPPPPTSTRKQRSSSN